MQCFKALYKMLLGNEKAGEAEQNEYSHRENHNAGYLYGYHF